MGEEKIFDNLVRLSVVSLPSRLYSQGRLLRSFLVMYFFAYLFFRTSIYGLTYRNMFLDTTNIAPIFKIYINNINLQNNVHNYIVLARVIFYYYCVCNEFQNKCFSVQTTSYKLLMLYACAYYNIKNNFPKSRRISR